MFETWRRLGVPLASVESPAQPPTPVPPVLHCTPASPWDVSSVFPCGGERKEDLLKMGREVEMAYDHYFSKVKIYFRCNGNIQRYKMQKTRCVHSSSCIRKTQTQLHLKWNMITAFMLNNDTKDLQQGSPRRHWQATISSLPILE